MKRLILSVLVVLAIAAAVVGCGTSNAVKSPSSGNTELQGTWTAPTSDATQTITTIFSGNNWTLTRTLTSTSQSAQESGTLTLNSAANPKTIDLYIATSTYPSDPNVGTTMVGIYLLSGTNLTLAMANSGEARPTSLTADNTIFLVKQ